MSDQERRNLESGKTYDAQRRAAEEKQRLRQAECERYPKTCGR
jgi:hypothetical protein